MGSPAIRVGHEFQRDLWNDLPVDAEFVLQPATGLFGTATCGKRLVIIVGLFLVFRFDIKRKPLVKGGIDPALSAVSFSPSSSKSKMACGNVLFPETPSVNSRVPSGFAFPKTDR